MKRKTIFAIVILIVFILVGFTAYLLIRSNSSQINEMENDNAETTQSFSFETVSSVNGKGITTAKVSNISPMYSVNLISKNIVSIEEDGVQLLMTNPGLEAFNIYSFKSNEFTKISKNEFFPNDILRYKDNGEIKESNSTQYLKYDTNYFYVDEVSKEDAQCSNQFGCSLAALISQEYNFYIYCSVDNSSEVSKCDQLLLNLKLNITQIEDSK